MVQWQDNCHRESRRKFRRTAFLRRAILSSNGETKESGAQLGAKVPFSARANFSKNPSDASDLSLLLSPKDCLAHFSKSQ